MPENAGFYEKYKVERKDGQPIEGRTFTLELDSDPYAVLALDAYVAALDNAGGFENAVEGLRPIVEELIEKGTDAGILEVYDDDEE